MLKNHRRPSLELPSEEAPHEDYDETPFQTDRDGTHKMHWSTPRYPDFKKVLDPRRFENEEATKQERKEEATEAWKAITQSLEGGEEAKRSQGSAEEQKMPTVSQGRLQDILDAFELNVNLSAIGLAGEQDENGNVSVGCHSS